MQARVTLTIASRGCSISGIGLFTTRTRYGPRYVMASIVYLNGGRRRSAFRVPTTSFRIAKRRTSNTDPLYCAVRSAYVRRGRAALSDGGSIDQPTKFERVIK